MIGRQDPGSWLPIHSPHMNCDAVAGLSRPLVGKDGLVQVGNAVGTIAYTAPETFTEKVLQKPSDVYAFGILSETSLLQCNPNSCMMCAGGLIV